MTRYLDIKLVTEIDGDNPTLGDIYLDANGEVVFIEGAEAIAQSVRCRLRMFKGEWFLNTDEGVPYFEEILEKGISDGRVAAILRQVVAGTPGITSVTSLTVTRDRDARSIQVDFEAVTDEGVNITSGDYGPLEVEV